MDAFWSHYYFFEGINIYTGSSSIWIAQRKGRSGSMRSGTCAVAPRASAVRTRMWMEMTKKRDMARSISLRGTRRGAAQGRCDESRYTPKQHERGGTHRLAVLHSVNVWDERGRSPALSHSRARGGGGRPHRRSNATTAE